MNEEQMAERIVQVMNEITETDGVAIRELVEHRVSCSRVLGEHPSIQVAQRTEIRVNWIKGGKGYSWSVGLLGILNGIAGALPDGYGRIEAVFNVDCPKVSECATVTNDPCLKGLAVGDRCPRCGSMLVLGALLGFKLADASKHQAPRSAHPDREPKPGEE